MKSRKLRKLVNTIMGFDGQKLEATIEEMKWGQKFQLLTRESKWFRGGYIREDGQWDAHSYVSYIGY